MTISADANAGTEDRVASGAVWSDLSTRVLWALILAPIALAAVWFGGPWLAGLLVVGGVIAGREWARLCDLTDSNWQTIMLMVSPPLAVIAVLLDAAAIGVGILTAVTLVLLIWRPASGAAASRWLAPGVMYVGLAFAAFMYMRATGPEGRLLVIWLLAVVWATDIAAYFAGRTIGGPKLAPRVSPSKTWAGLGGGILAAALCGFALAQTFGAPTAAWLAAVAAGALAISAQLGDILESKLKRLHGAKDSGRLIPGHGGLLDRIDGLMPATIVLCGLMIVKEGMNRWL